MQNDINHLDVNDEGLKGIFGERFHDETCPEAQHIPTKEETRKYTNVAKKPTEKPVEAQWEPVPHAPTQMEKIKACAKSALLYGGLSLLFFYFQQTEQMALGASMGCIIACVALAGFGIGKNVR